MQDSDKKTALSQEDLGHLVHIQRVDGEIARCRVDREKRPLAIAEKKGEIDEAQGSLDSIHQLSLDTQKSVDEHSVDSQAHQEEIAKLEGQLYSLKTNEEFEVMKGQIARKKETDDGIQEQVLDLMMSLDDLKEKQAQGGENVNQLKEQLARLEEMVMEQMARTDEKIADLEAKRQLIADELDDGIVELYTQLLGRRGGLGVVVLADKVCKGCDTHVLPQTVNQVVGGSLVQCPHCDRILYLQDQLD